MKIYKIKDGIVIQSEDKYYLLQNEDWDSFINDDDIYLKAADLTNSLTPVFEGNTLLANIEAPIMSQELWASGVTYLRSKVGRQEESKNAGGGDFYAHVYEAERPELFFKAMANRISGHGEKVRIRKDSVWNVPEPELTLVISSNGKIIGYTVGNDMSSRSIEGENPLYLPQAKTYDGCAALGPCILIKDKPLENDTRIFLAINRNGRAVFEGEIEINQIKRKFEELVSYLFRECTFNNGVLLMTGTGIVPPNDFTLQSRDEISISIDQIGTLTNIVE